MQVHSQIMKHLDKSRYRVFAITNSRGDSKADLENISGVMVAAVNFGSTFQGKRSIFQKLGNLGTILRTPFNFLSAWSFVRKHKIDLIHSPSQPRALFLSAFLVIFTRARLVVHVHGGNSYRMSKPARWLMSFELKRASAVVTVSSFIKDRVVSLGIEESKVHPILNTVDLDRFTPSAKDDGVKQEFGIDPDACLVAVIGRITPEKGQVDFLQAIAIVKERFPGVHGMIIGWDAHYPMADGRTYLQYLKDYCNENGLTKSVTFTGPRKDIERFYSAADVIVVPSAYEEPFGLVVIEAMAMAKPLVATRSGGIPEIVDNGVTGILVERKSPEELADAVTRFLCNAELRSKLGRQARIAAEKRFYERRLAEEVSRVYESVLSS